MKAGVCKLREIRIENMGNKYVDCTLLSCTETKIWRKNKREMVTDE
jgi:hypothetical protein